MLLSGFPAKPEVQAWGTSCQRGSSCGLSRGSEVSPRVACARRRRPPLRCSSTRRGCVAALLAQCSTMSCVAGGKVTSDGEHALTIERLAYSRRTDASRSRLHRTQNERRDICGDWISSRTRSASELAEDKRRVGTAYLQYREQDRL